VPGHTAGSVALHLPSHGVLFTGDTVAEGDGQALLGPFNVDRDQAWESLQRQAALDVEVACVGHGNPIRDARRALRAAVEPVRLTWPASPPVRRSCYGTLGAVRPLASGGTWPLSTCVIGGGRVG